MSYSAFGRVLRETGAGSPPCSPLPCPAAAAPVPLPGDAQGSPAAERRMQSSGPYAAKCMVPASAADNFYRLWVSCVYPVGINNFSLSLFDFS